MTGRGGGVENFGIGLKLRNYATNVYIFIFIRNNTVVCVACVRDRRAIVSDIFEAKIVSPSEITTNHSDFISFVNIYDFIRNTRNSGLGFCISRRVFFSNFSKSVLRADRPRGGPGKHITDINANHHWGGRGQRVFAVVRADSGPWTKIRTIAGKSTFLTEQFPGTIRGRRFIYSPAAAPCTI